MGVPGSALALWCCTLSVPALWAARAATPRSNRGLATNPDLAPPQLLAAHQYTVNFEWLSNATNLVYVDKMPFDGITIRFKNRTKGGPQSVHSNYSVNEAQLVATMMSANLRLLKNVTANWVAINAGVTPPFRNWSKIVVPNYRKLARAAKSAGLSGIYLDTEDYGAESGGRCVWWSNRVRRFASYSASYECLCVAEQ